jgi:hypothetical protein
MVAYVDMDQFVGGKLWHRTTCKRQLAKANWSRDGLLLVSSKSTTGIGLLQPDRGYRAGISPRSLVAGASPRSKG